MKKIIDGETYTISKSNRKNKKLMVTLPNDKVIHFGTVGMKHYKDKTGIWSDKDHGDKKRRENYLKRSGGIKDGKGNLTKNNKESANYWARKILW